MTKQERRKAMPETSAFIDNIRQHFGSESIVYISAKEGNEEITWQASRTLPVEHDSQGRR
jgi:hypothetical protein